MRNQRELILPDSFEDIKSELGEDLNRMMEFFVPLNEVEKEISIVVSSIKNSGKMVMMYGLPGSGKSTFIQSLKWRNNVPIREIHNINASEFDFQQSKLPQLLQRIREKCANRSIAPTSTGVIVFVVDYLENLSDEKPDNIKAFFRTLNGMLRQMPILVIWPITVLSDMDSMKEYANAVSGTLFVRGKENIFFEGPPKEQFPKILKNTISVLNIGYTFEDFQLIEEDFDQILEELRKQFGNNFTLRDYVIETRECWSERTGKTKEILRNIPKFTEVWCVFSLPEAENMVVQFVRKSKNNVDDCWDAYHSKLAEYIHDNKKAAFWTPNRLQLAISGSLKTKILFLPTNALVSCIAAYGKDFEIDKKVDWDSLGIDNSWRSHSTAKKFLENSSLLKQLKGKQVQLGHSRGGPVKNALEKARDAFDKINAISSNSIPGKGGSDEPFNQAIAKALSELLPQYSIKAEKPHPWLPNLIPDVLIDQPDKIVCLEFCYTKKKSPHVIADYVLNKLDSYMRQIESLYPSKLF